MSVTPLNWRAAGALAEQLLAGWQRHGEPGGAITLFDAQQRRATACAGLADLAQNTPFTADSVVRYASVTKHIFAALALNATDRAIRLDQRLGELLPALQPALADVTVGQALDMTGGLPDVRETLGLLGISLHAVSEAQPVMQFVEGLEKLNYEAGSEIAYSNTGYRLLEAALRSKGYDFDQLVQQHIARPLQVQMRAPESWFDVVPGLVPGYWRAPQGWQHASAGLHLSASGSLTGSLRQPDRQPQRPHPLAADAAGRRGSRSGRAGATQRTAPSQSGPAQRLWPGSGANPAGPPPLARPRRFPRRLQNLFPAGARPSGRRRAGGQSRRLRQFRYGLAGDGGAAGRTAAAA